LAVATTALPRDGIDDSAERHGWVALLEPRERGQSSDGGADNSAIPGTLATQQLEPEDWNGFEHQHERTDRRLQATATGTVRTSLERASVFPV
jgi:hypothetical protein